jgi:cystathionine beta-lyase
VLILTQVYNAFFNLVRNNGRRLQEFALDYRDGRYSVDLDRLENALADPRTTLMLLCNPHNPIGRIWDRDTLARIGGLARDNGVTVISDEIHCDITDPGCGYTPFASVSEACRNNCVVCMSPTKAFNLAGLLTAAAAVPDPQLRRKVSRALWDDEVAEPNAFAVPAAVAAFRKGGAWLDELRQYLYENKKLAAAFIAGELPGIRLIASEATYLLWLDCSGLGLASRELADHIRRTTGLFLVDGSIYGSPGGFLRMNIACPRVMLRDGLDRLKKAVALLP